MVQLRLRQGGRGRERGPKRLPASRRCCADGRAASPEVDCSHSGQRRGPGHADLQESEMTRSPIQGRPLPSQLLPETSVASTSQSSRAYALEQGSPARKRQTAAAAVQGSSPETRWP